MENQSINLFQETWLRSTPEGKESSPQCSPPSSFRYFLKLIKIKKYKIYKKISQTAVDQLSSNFQLSATEAVISDLIASRIVAVKGARRNLTSRVLEVEGPGSELTS